MKRTLKLIMMVTMTFFTSTSIHAMSYDKRTLHHACFDNDYTLAKMLLQEGADPNEYKGWRYSALFCAKSVGIADLLINHGADKNAVFSEDGTLLHNACRTEYPLELVLYYSVVQRLDVNSTAGIEKRTPLHYWAKHSLSSSEEHAFTAQEKLKALIAAGANTLITDRHGKTALDTLKETRMHWANSGNHYKDVVKSYDHLIPLLTQAMEAQERQRNK